MSQRKPELIVCNVPKEWTDEDKEEFRLTLIKATSHDRWENTQILITNKTDVNIIDAKTMDKLREL